MEYSEVKKVLGQCPDLQGLDEGASAALLWRGEECTLSEGEVIYVEGEKLDGTFCLLLSGDVIIEKAGEIIGGIWEQQIFWGDGLLHAATGTDGNGARGFTGSGGCEISVKSGRVGQRAFFDVEEVFRIAHLGQVREHVADVCVNAETDLPQG